MKKGMIWIIVGVLLLMAWFGAGAILAVCLWERNSAEMTDSASYTLRFGKVSTDDNPTFLEEATVLPLHYKDSGLRFGVQIVPSDDKPYTVYFIYHFSSPPKVVNGEAFAGKMPSTTIQTDPMTFPAGASVTSNWFDPGDPTGQQSMDVFINGKLVKTFTYTVVPDN